MNKIFQYAKTIAALIGAILTSVSAVIPDAPLWLTVALAIATAVSVFVVPNEVTDTQRKEVIDDIVPEAPGTYSVTRLEG